MFSSLDSRFSLSNKKKEAKGTVTLHGIQVEIRPSEKEKVEELLNSLEKIPTGQKALETLRKDKTRLTLDSNLNSKGAYYPEANMIALNDSLLNMDSMKFVLVHEARHREQSIMGQDEIANQNLDAASRLMLGRAIEADADVQALQACKEWEALGDTCPLKEFTCLRKAMVEAYDKNHSLSDAFKGWYADELTTAKYEHSYCIKAGILDIEYSYDLTHYLSAPLVSVKPADIAPFCGSDRVENFAEFLNGEQARQVHLQTKTILELHNMARIANGQKSDPSVQDIPTRRLKDNPEAKIQADAFIAKTFEDFSLKFFGQKDYKDKSFLPYIARALEAVKKINAADFNGSRDKDANKELETTKKDFFACIKRKKNKQNALLTAQALKARNSWCN